MGSGHLVRWWSNGLRHGVILEAGRKWAKVLYAGKVKRLALTSLESAE